MKVQVAVDPDGLAIHASRVISGYRCDVFLFGMSGVDGFAKDIVTIGKQRSAPPCPASGHRYVELEDLYSELIVRRETKCAFRGG